MAGLTIRDAEPDDAAPIAALKARIAADPDVTFTTHAPAPKEVADDIARACGEGIAFLVAALDGAFAGFATWRQFRGGPGYAFVVEHTIHLAPEAAGQGVGRQLLEALVARAQAQGMHAMIAGISGSNLAGIAFHAAMGFRQVGHLPGIGHKFGRRLDLILMQRDLDPDPRSDNRPDISRAEG